jgi:hypothetical protein
MISIIPTLARTLYFSCLWLSQYELLPAHLQRIIGPCPISPQHFQSINSLNNLRSTRDGSMIHNQGFQGWLVAKIDNEIVIQGIGATDWGLEDVSSYRAEICGNIATFTILTPIPKVYGFYPTNIEHICDNKSAITATLKYANVRVFDKTRQHQMQMLPKSLATRFPIYKYVYCQSLLGGRTRRQTWLTILTTRRTEYPNRWSSHFIPDCSPT